MRRIAFFSSILLCSLLETNQRLLRTSPKSPLRVTFFRKRRNNCCWDSPSLRTTLAKTIPPFRFFSRNQMFFTGKNKKDLVFQPNPEKPPFKLNKLFAVQPNQLIPYDSITCRLHNFKPIPPNFSVLPWKIRVGSISLCFYYSTYGFQGNSQKVFKCIKIDI